MGLFSFHGRGSRQTLIWLTVLNGLVAAGAVITVARFGGLSGHSVPALIAAGVLLGCLGAEAAALVKRLHDLGRPGWYAALLLVPPLTFYLGFLLLLKPGYDGQNRYGPDPLYFDRLPGYVADAGAVWGETDPDRPGGA